MSNLTAHPYIELGKTAQNNKPTIVTQGVIMGYSLPIYDNDNEEIFMSCYVPQQWDGISNPILVIPCYINTANINKYFKIQASWKCYYINSGVMPATSNDINVEIATGIAAQYQSFKLEFILDYDIDRVGNEMKSYDQICIRVRRIATSAEEIAGEVVLGLPIIQFF